MGTGLSQTLSLRGGSIWGQCSEHSPCLIFPLQQGPASAFLLCSSRGGCSALCAGLVMSGRSWGDLCPPTTPSTHARGICLMFQWLLNVLLCLCWQRVTPRPCCAPCHSHPSGTGVGDTHPPRAAQSSPLPAQELQDPHPGAAPSLLKGSGAGEGQAGLGTLTQPCPGEQRDLPSLDSEPHERAGPGRRRGAGGGGTGLSQAALLQSCSQALQRDSAQPQRSQPHRRGLFPQPGGNTRCPPSPCPPTAPGTPNHPLLPLSAVCPQLRSTSSSSSPSAGRDSSSRAGSDGEQGGVGLQEPSTSAVPIWICPFPPEAPFGIRGAEHQLLLWHFSRCWEKGFGVGFFSWGMGLKEMSGHIEQSGDFF